MSDDEARGRGREGSTRERVLIALLASATTFIGIWFALVAPLRRELASNRAELARVVRVSARPPRPARVVAPDLARRLEATTESRPLLAADAGTVATVSRAGTGSVPISDDPDRARRGPDRREPTIDELLRSATGHSVSSSNTTSASALPENPSRGDVQSAMQARASAVRACGGPSGTRVLARVTFGSNGRVTRAIVSAADANGIDAPVARCVERAVGDARVPPFGASSFSVSYPFAF